MFEDRRLGKFSIDVEVMNDRPDVVKALMGQCIVLRAEHLLASNVVEYVAQCDEFDEAEPGLVVPTYNIEITETDTEMVLDWKRVG